MVCSSASRLAVVQWCAWASHSHLSNRHSGVCLASSVITGHISISKGLAYIVVQIIGAALGVLLQVQGPTFFKRLKWNLATTVICRGSSYTHRTDICRTSPCFLDV
jgi:hypothetical protein